MIDFKKMDDKDFVFVNKPLSEKDEKAFSDFLKALKAKRKQKNSAETKKKISEKA